MRKSLLLIVAVVAGLFTASLAAKADNCGCYKDTRAEGISLCNRGYHQKAVEFFVAAKTCNDVPANNDLDELIATCRGHMSGFSITKLELGNTDEHLEPVDMFGDAYASGDLMYLTPRITYTSARTESVFLGVKVFRPDGTKAGKDDEEFTYTQTIEATAGSDNQLIMLGWGTKAGGSFEPGDYTVEIWSKGQCIASKTVTVLADNSAVSTGQPIYVNGANELTLEFPITGGTKHIEVKNPNPGEFKPWLLPDFCQILNETSKGFDLYCEPNKTPVYRKDYFLVSDANFENSATIYVRQESYAKPKKLVIDGKPNGEDISASFEFGGGKEIFFVETDSPDYDFWGIPYFCTIDKKTETSFFVVCSENESAYDRSDWFKVQAGELEVIIHINQAANPNGERYEDGDGDYSDGAADTYMGYDNVISDSSTWLEVLRHMMENPVKRYDDGSCSKGLLNNQGVRSGYGVYYWPVQSYYFGEWEDGDRTGMGIYIIGDFSYQFNNCPDAVVYVGEFRNNQANGRGSCYDKYGNLIYDGDFVDGVPQDTYPNGDTFEAGYKFQIYHIQEGDLWRWYVGETYNTNRHGWGILIWDDYDCCFGRWADDLRSTEESQLFMTRDGKEIEMRQY